MVAKTLQGFKVYDLHRGKYRYFKTRWGAENFQRNQPMRMLQVIPTRRRK